MPSSKKTIAVLGGTGQQGGALALRWARAGHAIVIGSRDGDARGGEGARAARRACRAPRSAAATWRRRRSAGEIVVLSVPLAAHRATLEAVREAVQGKILVDVTVPLVPPRVARVQLPPEGCGGGGGAGAAGARRQGGVGVPERRRRICSRARREIAMRRARLRRRQGGARRGRGARPRRGAARLHGGALANSAAAEALTSVLIFLNGRYRATSGIRLHRPARSDGGLTHSAADALSSRCCGVLGHDLGVDRLELLRAAFDQADEFGLHRGELHQDLGMDLDVAPFAEEIEMVGVVDVRHSTPSLACAFDLCIGIVVAE